MGFSCLETYIYKILLIEGRGYHVEILLRIKPQTSCSSAVLGAIECRVKEMRKLCEILPRMTLAKLWTHSRRYERSGQRDNSAANRVRHKPWQASKAPAGAARTRTLRCHIGRSGVQNGQWVIVSTLYSPYVVLITAGSLEIDNLLTSSLVV
jgi:hypothetical protein